MNREYELLLDTLVQGGYLKTDTIIEAFRAIDRKEFVPQEYQADAYVNTPLPIGYEQTISQPLVVAFMLELLAPKPGEKILEIGSGSGWQTGIMAQIVSALPLRGTHERKESGTLLRQSKKNLRKMPLVVGIERIPELTERAKNNLRKYNFLEKRIVELFTGDGTKGWEKEAPYDKIMAGASAAGAIPEAWKAQIKIGGRIVAPVAQSIIVLDKIGSNEFSKKEYFGFDFVPLIEQ